MHKKECRKRAAEVHDEKLFKQPPPPEDCPICFLPAPMHVIPSTFKSCCGKLICCGCIYEMRERGRKDKEVPLCPFCRTPEPSIRSKNFGPYEEENKRLEKLMELGYAEAFFNYGCYYKTGEYGKPQDYEKANELWLKAGELGSANSYTNLGYSYENGLGVEIDKKKAKHYFELAAMSGNLMARYNLGVKEWTALDTHGRGLKHFMISASGGYKLALDAIKVGFMKGGVAKEEYASALRAYQKATDGMKSDARDKDKGRDI